jgi:hypothetical protein
MRANESNAGKEGKFTPEKMQLNKGHLQVILG